MAELTTRGYRPDDAGTVTDLYNVIEQAGGGHPGLTPADTAAMVAGMIADPATDTRLVFAGDTLVAFGFVSTPPPGGFRVDTQGGVHPAWRGRGIGRELLGWQIARATEIRQTVRPDPAWELEAGASVHDGSALKLFERLGFGVARYFFEMSAPTATVPAVALPPGLRSEVYRPEWEKTLYGAHLEAFADHWGYQKRDFDAWTAFTVRSASFLPDLSRVAFDGDELAGYVLSYDDADDTRVYIGHVGTRREWRRRGLAGALLAEVLAASAAAGRVTAGLGVDADSPTGAVGVYERVGFAVESRWVAYRRPVD